MNTQVNNDEIVFDRSLRIEDATNGHTFPAPEAYDEVDIDQDPELYGKAPWFYRETVSQARNIIESYATDGWLPGGIPLNCVFTQCWRDQFACLNRDIFVGHGRTIEGLRANFAKLASAGFNRLMTYTPVNPEVSGMFLYWTLGEQGYMERISAIEPSRVEAWRGRFLVSDEAMCFSRPQLVTEFRFIQKRGN